MIEISGAVSVSYYATRQKHWEPSSLCGILTHWASGSDPHLYLKSAQEWEESARMDGWESTEYVIRLLDLISRPTMYNLINLDKVLNLLDFFVSST